MSRHNGVIAAVVLAASLGASLAPSGVVHAAMTGAEAYPPPSWSTIPDGHTPRAEEAATTGLTGLIYILGGYDCTMGDDCTGGVPVALKSMEIYSPTTKSWSVGPPMHVAREAFAAVTGTDGRIYAFGGAANNGALIGSAEAYSPKTNKWTLLAPLPTAVRAMAAVAGPDGRIYVLGGWNGTQVVSTVQAYSPTTNKWAIVAPMPTPREWLAGVRDRLGRIYAIGGDTGFSNTVELATAEMYTVTTNTWTTVAPMPTGRGGLAGARGPDGQLYLLGGIDNSTGGETNVAEAYNPTTNVWTEIAPMPAAEAFLAAARGSDGRIYAVDGADGFGGACCPGPGPGDDIQILTV